jgi:L-cysteine S-thiosulfotransferase
MGMRSELRHRASGIGFLAAALTCGLAVVGVARAAEAPLLLDGPASASPWKRYGNSPWPQTSFAKYNTLNATNSPPAPAAGTPRKLAAAIAGDPKKGKDLAFDRARGGGCLTCHIMGPDTQSLPGNAGPDLSLISTFGRTDEWLFNYVYDARVYNPDSYMPPWGAHGIFNDEEISDIVAFLKTLKAPKEFTGALEDPAKRPAPVETRDNFDPLVNPAVWELEKGEALYKKAGAGGKACATCHADPKAAFKTWAATMPKIEPRLKKPLSVEEFVYRHAAATTGDKFPMQSDENLQLAVYLRYLANGQPIHVDPNSPGAREAIARAEVLMERRIGQLDFSCNDCHTAKKAANKWVRGQLLGEFRGQISQLPRWRTRDSQVWDLRKRFQWCNVAIRADELPPDAAEYADIEYRLSVLNNGIPLKVPGIGH